MREAGGGAARQPRGIVLYPPGIRLGSMAVSEHQHGSGDAHDPATLVGEGDAPPAPGGALAEARRLADRARLQMRRAAAMTRMASRVVLAESLQDSLRGVCEGTAEALAVTLATVYLFDDRTGLASGAHLHGLPPGIVARTVEREPTQALVAKYGTLAQFPDIRDVPELPHRERMIGNGARSLAYAALTAEGEFLGVLAVATFGDDVRRFDAEEMELLGTGADLVASSLIRERHAERNAMILRTMSEGVVLADAQRVILYANQAFERMLGYEPGELVGKHGSVVWFPEDLPQAATLAAHLRAESAPTRRVLRYRTKAGGEVWASVAFVPVRVADAFAGSVTVASDVTQARKLEMKLQQAQKLESLGVLAGGIAHDFNNLLVGILGNAGLALEELPPEAPAREQIDDIHVAAIRAAELTKQLLAYAGKGRFVIARIDVRRLVEEMSHLLSAVIPKNALLKYSFAANVPPVDGDAAQLRQIVMNLITNAADAIGERSGIITVSTSVVEADRTYLSDTYLDEGLPPGHYVSLEVADTGVGMSPDMRSRIFDPFFTTKFTGRGLGLAAVLGILRSHRGAIKVYSEPGRGSTFRVLLPAASGGPESIRPRTPPVERPQEVGLILVVDDDEAVRSVAKRALERAGFQVLTAADGVEGIEVFSAHKGAIRAVLLDVTMPRMGGEEAFRRLRQIDPDVRVLLSSGYSEQEATSVFAGKGLAGFLEKPFTTASLLDRLRAVLDRSAKADAGSSV